MQAVEILTQGFAILRCRNTNRLAFCCCDIECVKLTIRVIGHEEYITFARNTREAVNGMIGWLDEIPWDNRLSICADFDQTARKGSENESVAFIVAFAVLETAVYTIGRLGQVCSPQQRIVYKVELDKQVVALDILASGIKGSACVDDDRESVSRVDSHTA